MVILINIDMYILILLSVTIALQKLYYDNHRLASTGFIYTIAYKSINDLKTRQQQLRFKFNNLEMYPRCINFRIFGIKEEAGENTYRVILTF